MQVPISFEFFPPKTAEGVDKLRAVRAKLYAYRPEFCSVTFGAGGSTQDGTLQTIRDIMAEGCAAAPHLSCIGQSKDSIRARLVEYAQAGVERIVALRGDLPSGYGLGGEFRYASDLIAFIRQETGERFHIEAAAYPETHPQAHTPEADLKAFVAKVQAGARSGITQYFFNADAYARYCDEIAKLGVSVPIVPGIMPISSSSQLLRFSDMCGAEVPRWIRLRLQAYGDDSASIKAFGADVVARLCEQLQALGAPALHFYTLNQSVAVLEILKRLQRT